MAKNILFLPEWFLFNVLSFFCLSPHFVTFPCLNLLFYPLMHSLEQFIGRMELRALPCVSVCCVRSRVARSSTRWLLTAGSRAWERGLFLWVFLRWFPSRQPILQRAVAVLVSWDTTKIRRSEGDFLPVKIKHSQRNRVGVVRTRSPHSHHTRKCTFITIYNTFIISC